MIALPRRSFPALVATLVVALVSLVGCAGTDDAASPTTTAPAGGVETTAAPDTTVVETTTTAEPEPAYRSWIANVNTTVSSVIVHDSPGGPQLQLDTSGTGPLRAVAIANPLPSGAPATFLVRQRGIAAAGATWAEVYLPVRPNGSTGWIAESDVTYTHTDMAATISLTTHQLQLSDAGAVIATYPIANGATGTPTPTGTFFVKELVEPPSATGAYGPLAYGLSAFSPTLVDTDAFADGVIGIHGTNEPQLIGQAVSHGCVRVNNADVLDLEQRQVPLGMPVTITA